MDDLLKIKLCSHSNFMLNLLQPTLMKSGITVDVKVTSVESPSKFHIMCKGDEHVYYLNMQEEMQEMYSNDLLNIYSLYYPRLHMVCSALAKDGSWYRAKVVSPPKLGKVCNTGIFYFFFRLLLGRYYQSCI